VRCPERRLLPTSALLAICTLAVLGCAHQSGPSDRQAQVAERAAQVMPFDLGATTHTFTKNANGGVQAVTADDPGDATQVGLIRQHLRDERTRFSTGDFSDPARIHGMDMPGVSALASGYRSITVTYNDLPDGAELLYSTNDPTLIDALHSWFDRQVMDHGDHAEAG
jgi:hypothetical protein